MTCPKCEQRAKDERQALSQCEKQQQQATTVNQRMGIAIAVLSTLIGKEAFDRFTQVTDVVNTLQVGQAEEPDRSLSDQTVIASTPKAPKTQASTSRADLGFTVSRSILADIPGSILPPFEPRVLSPVFTAGFLTDPPDRFVPFAGPMLLFGLAMVRPRKRKQ